MNTQPIVKQDLATDGSVLVHHVFRTIQGEGPFVGRPSIFVRLAGCNLQCPLCDTDYSSLSERLYPAQVLGRVRSLSGSGRNIVVLTGGEPLRQNIAPLATALMDAGYMVQIETNGTLWVPDLPVWNPKLYIVCSPKTGKLNPDIRPFIMALKYVATADDLDADGLPRTALGHASYPRLARPWDEFGGTVYLQPCDTGDEVDNWRHRQAVIQSCVEHGYTLCLQIHKLINLE